MAKKPSVAIGTERQLFLDDYLIETLDNVRRGVDPSVKYKGNPVLKPDNPWEINALLFGSVHYEPETGFRMWYHSRNTDYKYAYVSYATSEDGIAWDKPPMDLVPLDGQPTAAVFGPSHAPHMGESYTVLADPDDPDPDKRYKLIFYNTTKRESPCKELIRQKYADTIAEARALGHEDRAELLQRWHERITATGTKSIGTATSPDGIHWGNVRPEAVKDVWDAAHLTYDPYRKRYLIYTQDFFVPADVHSKYRDEEWYRTTFLGRSIQCSESADFENWTTARRVLHADLDDGPCDEIYMMAVFPYQGLYIGLVQMFHAHPQERSLDIQLAVSRDGYNWTRAGNRETFIPLGGIGEWDRFNHSVATGPTAVGDELRFYYTGRTYRHPPHELGMREPRLINIGFASVKKDRFVHLAADFDGGSVLTKPLHFVGRQLHVNAKCDWGKLKISLLDESGMPHEGYVAEIAGHDAVDIPVSWGNLALDALQGRAVGIRFELYNVKLYAFWID